MTVRDAGNDGAGGCWNDCGALTCGYCLEASMTAGSVVLACFTLTFDSSPIKGEGDFCRLVVLDLLSPRCGCWIKSAMTGRATSVNQ